MRRTWTVTRALARVSLMTALQYRSNLVFGMFAALLGNAARVAPLLLVFEHTDAVAGWTRGEALLVMAFFMALTGVQHGLFEPSLGEAVRSIRAGTLDLLLLKPADAQLLVSVRKLHLESAWEFVSALLLLAAAVLELGPPAPGNVVVALGLFALGVAALYGLWILAISAAFWFVRVDNLRFLLWSATDTGRWPASVFSPGLRWVLTLVVPVVVVTTLPAEAWRGGWTAGSLALAAAVATGFLAVSRRVWRWSLGAYTSAAG